MENISIYPSIYLQNKWGVTFNNDLPILLDLQQQKDDVDPIALILVKNKKQTSPEQKCGGMS